MGSREAPPVRCVEINHPSNPGTESPLQVSWHPSWPVHFSTSRAVTSTSPHMHLISRSGHNATLWFGSSCAFMSVPHKRQITSTSGGRAASRSVLFTVDMNYGVPRASEGFFSRDHRDLEVLRGTNDTTGTVSSITDTRKDPKKPLTQ